MSALGEIYLKVETLKTLHDVVLKKGEKGISLTLSINDETNDYSQNISSFVAQSKEDREAGKKKFYVGNGKIFWTDGTIKVATKAEHVEVHNAEIVEDDDLPF